MLRVDKIKERYSIMFSIEKAKGVIIYILKCSVESRDTVLNTWEVELYKVIAENGKLNYDFIPTSLFRGCPLIRG